MNRNYEMEGYNAFNGYGYNCERNGKDSVDTKTKFGKCLVGLESMDTEETYHSHMWEMLSKRPLSVEEG